MREPAREHLEGDQHADGEAVVLHHHPGTNAQDQQGEQLLQCICSNVVSVGKLPGGEPGVEIVVHPAGKKLQSLGLLSGGEKALTAVALILSLFLIRPTPFCLLDEVDAPLDEANIGRFNQLIQDMAAGSQFVLITHNRRTMEAADTLYGITMEQAGVSKVVSVRLRAAA